MHLLHNREQARNAAQKNASEAPAFGAVHSCPKKETRPLGDST